MTSGGEVLAYDISPNSNRVVYWADQDTDEVRELYSVPLTGGSPVKLNDTLVSDGDVNLFRISPNSNRVIYQADQETDEVDELYSVPILGGSPVKLNGPLISGGDVSEFLTGFAISPNSNRVIYQADQETDEVDELYSVPILGGSPVKLNGPLISGGDVSKFEISPSGGRVIYLADQETDQVNELYAVPLVGGSPPLKLNGPLVSGGEVDSFQESPANPRILYRANQETVQTQELFMTYNGSLEIAFTDLSATVPEDQGVVSVTVQLSELALENVQVDYAVTGGTATAGGVDYSLPAGPLLFGPGVVSRSLDMTVINDSDPEPDETVVISLSNPQNANLGSPNVFTLTIQANDGAPGSPADGSIFLPLVVK